MPPPLPPQLITTILSHLLPPQPPLPPSLLATPLLDRLKFLPPDEADLDAWLSPIPSPSHSPSILSDRLQRLAVTHHVEPIVYAHDGEGVIARLSLRDEQSHPSETPSDNGGIDIMFSYEHADQARGWVYHSSLVPSSPGDDLHSWSSSPDIPLTPPDDSQGNADPGVEDYWKGFTPPTPTADLPQADEDVEDAYWASYGGGHSGHASPTRNRSMANLQKLRAEEAVAEGRENQTDDLEDGREDQFEADLGQPERVMCDMPTTANNVLDPLAALLATIPDSLGRDSPTPASPSREATDLRDKVLGRIQASLRDVWAGYTRDAEARPESLEEKAHGWLRIARGVVDNTEVHESSMEEVVVKAKMEVLRELYVVVAPSTSRRGSDEMAEESDGFWRCVEGAIKMPMVPGSANDDGMTQETYWE